LTGITVKNDLGEIIRTAEYTYDVYNQRIAKTVYTDGDGSLAAVTERFVYGSDQNIALVLDENGNVNHRYLFGDGVDQIEADESNGTVLWALTDHLGSVRDVVDDSGTVLNHIVYDAFGGVTSQTDESVVFRYGYTARELDAESGLQYNRARYLDSFTGKFISEDPIGFGGGDSNLYRYVFNSPIRYTDPSGLFVVEGATSTTNPLGLLVAPALIIYDLIFPQPADAPTFPSNSQTDGCTRQERYELQREVSRLCKSAESGRSCHSGMSRAEALDNAAKFEACAAARDTINNRCFGGGDSGHQERANNDRRAAQKCRDQASMCQQ
jgi:RHS repeat-associated protein